MTLHFPQTLQRLITGLVIMAMTLSPLAGCGTFGPPSTIELSHVVVETDRRLASTSETGYVTVTRDGRAIPAGPGMALRKGDVVVVGAAAVAVIRYPSGSVAYLRPNSRGRIGSLTDWIGEVFVKVRGAFVVQTELVRAGAQGTAFDVNTVSRDLTRVVVYEGHVTIDSTVGAWPGVLLAPGQMITAGRKAPAPVAADTAEMQRTREWVDNVDQLLKVQGGVQAGAIAVGIVALIAILLGGRRDKSDRDGDSGSAYSERRTDAPGTKPAPPPPAPAPEPAPTAPPSIIK